LERHQRGRHRQLANAFAIDIGSNVAIAGDCYPDRVASRYLRLRNVAAISEFRHDPGQALPSPQITEQDDIELAIPRIGARSEHQAFAGTLETAQQQT